MQRFHEALAGNAHEDSVKLCFGKASWIPNPLEAIAGQLMHLFESLKNNRLFCCLANPFLDA
jgi:hypothetical protein